MVPPSTFLESDGYGGVTMLDLAYVGLTAVLLALSFGLIRLFEDL